MPSLDERLAQAAETFDRVAEGAVRLAAATRRARFAAGLLAFLLVALGLYCAAAWSDLRARRHAAEAEERAARAGGEQAAKAAADGRAILETGIDGVERRVRDELAAQGRALRAELAAKTAAGLSADDAQARRDTLDALLKLRAAYLRRIEALRADLEARLAQARTEAAETARGLAAAQERAQREASEAAAAAARATAAEGAQAAAAETEGRLRGEINTLEKQVRDLTDEVRRLSAERGAAATPGPEGAPAAPPATAPGGAPGEAPGPATAPPAGQPPAGQPPAGQPPAGQPPAGQPPVAEEPAPAGPRKWAFLEVFGKKMSDWAGDHLSGSLEYRAYGHFRPTPQDTRALRNEGRLRLKYTSEIAPWLSTVDKLSLRTDDDQLARDVFDRFADDATHRRILDLDEAYFDLRFGPVDLSLGKKIYAWGKAFLWNPTDRVNPLDYTDVIDSEKIGVFSADAKVHAGAVTFEGVFVPTFTPARFPLRDSRWAVIENDAPVLVLDRDPIEESQYGARVLASLGGWDLSATWYEGINPNQSGQLGAILVPTASPPFFAAVPTVTPRYNKYRMAGGDVATTFGRLEVHGEVAHFWQDDSFNYDSYFQYVVGGEYRIPNVDHDHDLRLQLEYAGEVTTDCADDASDRVEVFFNRPYQGTLATKVRYDYSDDGHLDVAVVYNLDGPDNYYLQPSVVHQLADGISLEAGASLFFGPPERNFGFYGRNDRAYVIVTYSF